MELTPQQRMLSCAELCVAISIVVAHNVYHWISNEVPILVTLAVISFRIREGKWGTHLYSRPVSWRWTVASAIVCLLLLQLKDAVFEPVGQRFWPGRSNLSSVISQNHDAARTLLTVLFVWVFAAFGEEFGYRGYLLKRATDVFGPSSWGIAAALLIASVAFGLGHFYKGRAGMLESAGSGIVLGSAFLFTRRLWVGSLAHGLNDTVAIVYVYLGW